MPVILLTQEAEIKENCVMKPAQAKNKQKKPITKKDW
jgi:hypothetical protein